LFVEKLRKGEIKTKANRGIEPRFSSLILSAVTAAIEVVGGALHPIAALHLVALHRVIHCDTTFGVFFWFEVLDFDRFSFLVLLGWHV
jgi:hypothetical protein